MDSAQINQTMVYSTKIAAIASLITAIVSLITVAITTYFNKKTIQQSEIAFQKTYTGFLIFADGDIKEGKSYGEDVFIGDFAFENIGPGKLIDVQVNIVSPSFLKVIDLEPEPTDTLHVTEFVCLQFSLPLTYLDKLHYVDIEIVYRNVLGKKINTVFSFELIDKNFKLIHHTVKGF